MFKRLNTGGEKLTPQQLRNCTIRLLDPAFNSFIIELSNQNNFKLCTSILTQDLRLGAYDQELVLRFFALRNHREQFKHDVSDFLTDYMEGVSDPDPERRILFDYGEQRTAFERTFEILAATLADESFAYVNPARGNLVRGFSVYHFEAFTLGIQPFLDRVNLTNAKEVSALKGVFTNIKLSQEFVAITRGGGKNSPGPLRDRIRFVEDRLTEFYGL